MQSTVHVALVEQDSLLPIFTHFYMKF